MLLGKKGNAMMLTLYGIRNCDTMKKARTWLDQHSIEYVFHDYKVSGIDRAQLERWCGQLGWEAVLNRAGRTFRALSPADQQVLDVSKAVRLMSAQPSMIKRPILEGQGVLLVGFKPEMYEKELNQKRG